MRSPRELFQIWARAIRRPLWKNILVAEAILCLIAFRCTLKFVPFRVIGRRLRSAEPESSSEMDAQTLVEATSWAVQWATRLLCWREVCLVQALAAKWMLRRRGLRSTLYLGVRHGQAGALEAHAWLQCSDFWVVGGDGSGFTELAQFVG